MFNGGGQLSAVSLRDVMAAEALRMYEESLCSGCGQPSWLSYEDGEKYTVATVTCAACAVVEADAREREHPAPGSRTYAVYAGGIDYQSVMAEVSAERDAFKRAQQRLREAANA